MRYIAVIQRIGVDGKIFGEFESTEDFETYFEAFSYMEENLPNGFEGHVEQLPEVNLEEICIAKEPFVNQLH